MIIERKGGARGHFDHGWLDTYHTFSFGDYQDPAQMGFRSLRVINEDTVRAGEGFGRHGHRDMEILTYVLDGALRHEDSTGGGGVLKPGDVQRMSAGTGVMHSEFNASDQERVHFLQIWIVPDRRGVPARYDDHNFSLDERKNRLRLIASPDAAEGSLSIHQDARVYASVVDTGAEVSLDIGEGRHGWIQVARGDVAVTASSGATARLAAGDGAGLSGERRITLKAGENSEVLLFDLA